MTTSLNLAIKHAQLGSVRGNAFFTCQRPKIVRIQVLPERVFGCLWDIRT